MKILIMEIINISILKTNFFYNWVFEIGIVWNANCIFFQSCELFKQRPENGNRRVERNVKLSKLDRISQTLVYIHASGLSWYIGVNCKPKFNSTQNNVVLSRAEINDQFTNNDRIGENVSKKPIQNNIHIKNYSSDSNDFCHHYTTHATNQRPPWITLLLNDLYWHKN